MCIRDRLITEKSVYIFTLMAVLFFGCMKSFLCLDLLHSDWNKVIVTAVDRAQGMFDLLEP